ncbi:MAG: ribonuclease III [Firmicutes bacterium]|nr:ribonuclease III [Bacillota bacterium]
MCTGIPNVEAAIGYAFRDPSLLVEALTHSSWAAEEGVGRAASNERLEYLGDAVLKMVVAEHLLWVLPTSDEGRLSRISAQVVSGRALAKAAAGLELPSHLRLGRGEDLTGGRAKPRNLAGAMEALIGAIYLDAGLDAARRFILDALAHTMDQAIHGPAPDFKTTLQETAQGNSLGPVTYRIVEQVGPAHRPRFTAEVLLGDSVAGRGEGTTKRAAEQEAARAALRSIHFEG